MSPWFWATVDPSGRAAWACLPMIIHTALNDGTPVCIRQVRQDDEARLKAGIAQLTPQSRYLRFFSGNVSPPQGVIDRLLDVDGHDHISWGAIRMDAPGRPAIGIVHAFRDEAVPDAAEFSVAVLDEYHGLGLARMLTAVLLLDCRREGYEKLVVHILPENRPATTLAKSLGADHIGFEAGVSHFGIDIDGALSALRNESGFAGLSDVFARFSG